jgi:hypothetical protein
MKIIFILRVFFERNIGRWYILIGQMKPSGLAYWAVVYLGHFLEHFRRSAHFCDTVYRAMFKF